MKLSRIKNDAEKNFLIFQIEAFKTFFVVLFSLSHTFKGKSPMQYFLARRLMHDFMMVMVTSAVDKNMFRRE